MNKPLEICVWLEPWNYKYRSLKQNRFEGKETLCKLSKMCCRTISRAVARANRCGLASASSSQGLGTACRYHKKNFRLQWHYALLYPSSVKCYKWNLHQIHLYVVKQTWSRRYSCNASTPFPVNAEIMNVLKTRNKKLGIKMMNTNIRNRYSIEISNDNVPVECWITAILFCQR